MKLLKHTINRTSNDRIRVDAEWTDRMRRPAVVTVSVHKGPNTQGLPSGALIDEDNKEGTDTMFALAEIAWSMGWRPRGLAGTLAGLVANFKLPPEDR